MHPLRRIKLLYTSLEKNIWTRICLLQISLERMKFFLYYPKGVLWILVCRFAETQQMRLPEVIELTTFQEIPSITKDIFISLWRVLTAYLRLLSFLPTRMFSPGHFKHLDLNAATSGMEQRTAWIINEAQHHCDVVKVCRMAQTLKVL